MLFGVLVSSASKVLSVFNAFTTLHKSPTHGLSPMNSVGNASLATSLNE
ncbi:hypothetical protein SAMN04487996_114226 [Dyadobacter soli]|uniref:Uncharacterized protein n=1 Tax=Dyadobacter soli TaxID=659014 RepID=A0A1G7R2J2_9BACT|nr:hypothetical protein SAMN04487996_114226 [Dyadobacter soli]